MGLPGATSNLALYAGTDKTYRDLIITVAGTPQDITGWAIEFGVHAYGDPTTVFFKKTTGAGQIVISNGPGGQCDVSVLAADTAGMYPGEYQFYLKRTDFGAVDDPTVGLFSILIA